VKVQSLTVGAFQENCYLLIDEQASRAVLIDPGAEPERLIAMVEASGASLDAIWLTHAHIDHVGGIVGVRRRWRVPVHLHAADLPLFERAEAQAALYGLSLEQPEAPDVLLADGDVLHAGRLAFDVLHTPGHAPGHVIFHRGDVVFGGDLLFAGSIGRTDLPLSDPAAMEESLARICALGGDTIVHPGHGPSTSVGAERETNAFLTGGVRLVRR
jgi:glyoxylase-like metal-dependent hydrolase (beta-lactamase superfamily II)